MGFEGNFKGKKEVVRIKCSNDGLFTGVEIVIDRKVDIENRCIEFINHITKVMNYIYVTKSDCKCCLLNGKIIYIYRAIKYFYSRSEIKNSNLKSIHEVVVVDSQVAVSTDMLSDKLAKYNKRLIHHGKVSLEENGIDSKGLLPLKIMIVKKVSDDSYVSISGGLLKCIEVNYDTTIRSYYYYNKLVLSNNIGFKYAICKLDNGKFFYVDNSLDKMGNNGNKLFCVKHYTYEQFNHNCLHNIDVIDRNIEHLGTINTGDKYDYILKYSVIVKYLLNNYKVSNDLCTDMDIRSKVNDIMQNYRKGNFRSWEFKLDKAKNSQLIALVLLQYREGLLNNSQLPKFSNCISNEISNSDIISIAEKVTELRNSYCHGREVRIKCLNSLHELLNEIYHLVIFKEIGILATSIVIDKLYKYLALTTNYNDEIGIYKANKQDDYI